jgi:prepilin-type N-terminal cleavage/methylation domain-containing protein
MSSTPKTRASGFTLIELLVAVGLLAIVFIGILNMLDTSTTVSKVEGALADTQENVRFAAYHIMRTVRMTGGGEMPFARDDGTWVCGRLQNNETGAVTTDLGTVQVAAGSDVLTLRGFYEAPPFFTNRFDVRPDLGKITIRERRQKGDASSDVINSLVGVDPNSLVGRGVMFMGRREFAVGKVTTAAFNGEPDPDRQLEIYYDGGDGPWPTLNPSGAAISGTEPAFNVYRVGIMNSYTYFVAPDNTLMRQRADSSGSRIEPVAVNIGSLQVVFGVDTTGDGVIDTWSSTATAAQAAAGMVGAMRITVLGRTPFDVRNLSGAGSGWQEPVATFQIEGDPALDASLFNRGAKWRRMDVTAGLRNFTL